MCSPSAYSLSFPVILVKIVRTVMVTSIFGRSVSLPDPYIRRTSIFEASQKAKEEWKLKAWHQFPQPTTSNMAAGMGFNRPLSFR